MQEDVVDNAGMLTLHIIQFLWKMRQQPLNKNDLKSKLYDSVV